MPKVAGSADRSRVLRGGSFNNDSDNLRCANRNDTDPDNRDNNIGFRVVVVAGGSACKVPDGTIGVMQAGQPALPARAKRTPNRSTHAPEKPGKRRGGGLWPVAPKAFGVKVTARHSFP